MFFVKRQTEMLCASTFFDLVHFEIATFLFINLSTAALLTNDLLASGRNCPNSASRSSCPLNRLATFENTSSSVIPLLPRLPRLSFTSSCSFWGAMGKNGWSEVRNQTLADPHWNSLTTHGQYSLWRRYKHHHCPPRNRL